MHINTFDPCVHLAPILCNGRTWIKRALYMYSDDNISVMHVFPNYIKTMHWTIFNLWAMGVEFLATT